MVYYRSGGFGSVGSRGVKRSKVGWEVDLYVRGLKGIFNLERRSKTWLNISTCLTYLLELRI